MKYAIRFRKQETTPVLVDVQRADSMRTAIAEFQITFPPEKYTITSITRITEPRRNTALDMGCVDMAQGARF